MFKVIPSMKYLVFSQLMDVYEESNRLNGRELYPVESLFDQIREAEQDFYHYLVSVFFRQSNSYYAVWIENKKYVSALRVEPYLDGLLLCALETIPNERNKGYASRLLSSLTQFLEENGSGILYSHVSKDNTASLNAHLKCGFQILKDHAVYSDGSVIPGSYTLSYIY